MSSVRFIVAIEPKGQARPRAVSVGGHARVYQSTGQRLWQAEFAAIAAPYVPSTPMAGPLVVQLGFVLSRPKRLMGRKHPEGLMYCPSKPDIDNLAKSVLDAMRAFWRDDAQVVCLSATKRYAEKKGGPRVEVEVEEM